MGFAKQLKFVQKTQIYKPQRKAKENVTYVTKQNIMFTSTLSTIIFLTQLMYNNYRDESNALCIHPYLLDNYVGIIKYYNRAVLAWRKMRRPPQGHELSEPKKS